jgi:hypothetical protein
MDFTAEKYGVSVNFCHKLAFFSKWAIAFLPMVETLIVILPSIF